MLQLYCDNNITVLKRLVSEGQQVDAIITDPPYEFGFMEQTWDSRGVSHNTEFWKLVCQVLKPGGHLLALSGSRTYHRMAVAIEDAGFEIRDQLMWLYGSGFPKNKNIGASINQHSKTNAWDGWGTALKPAHEPIVLARKPLSEKLLGENVLKHGTGAINIEACRIALHGDYKSKPNGRPSLTRLGDYYDSKTANLPDTVGRFPANVIHDGSSEVLEAFPETRSRFSRQTPARFFYCAKASTKERNEGILKNIHPTVKPIALMEYLCTLITPRNGIVLDPFMGSGTTGIACINNQFNFIVIELEPEYYEIAQARLAYYTTKTKQDVGTQTSFL